LSDVDGTCQKVEATADQSPDAAADQAPDAGVEHCDGLDNDGDTLVDEDWPELGEPCGQWAGVGECAEGAYVCANDGTGVVCEGEVGPIDEVCDGKDNDCDGTPDNGPAEICDGEDNDCDGLIDEGVLSVKGDLFDDHTTVTAIEGGFVVSRIVADQLRVETYDRNGKRTGHHDDIDNPSPTTAFLDSDSVDERALVALGRYPFHVVEIRVDSDLVPVISGAQSLHSNWSQLDIGAYFPPYHPRVVASPPRFVGYPTPITFALNPFAADNLIGLAQAPTIAPEFPSFTPFDAASIFLTWEHDDNIRVGVLQDEGSLALDIDAARGSAPSIALRPGGFGLAFLQDGRLRLSEFYALGLQCVAGGFCNETIRAAELQGALSGPTGLAFDAVTDTWFVIAGTQLAVVGRSDAGAVVTQAVLLDAIEAAPVRVDVAVSGRTAAVVQSTPGGASALTFLGCF